MKEIVKEDDNFICTKEDGVLNIHCKTITNPDDLLKVLNKE